MALASFVQTDPTAADLEDPAERAPRRKMQLILAAEREQWPHWIVVSLGLGVALYFALPVEPPAWLTGVGVLVAMGATLVAWRELSWRVVALCVLAMTIGVGAGAWRTHRSTAPVIAEEIEFATIVGRVVARQPRPSGYRLILDEVSIEGIAAPATPRRIRVTSRAQPADWIELTPGDWIEGLAGLSPPSPPAMPGAYDFQRAAWYQGLGAVGFTYGQPHRVAGPEGARDGGLGRRLSVRVARLRQLIFARVIAVLPGRTGAIAAALMVGERGAIPEATQEAMRRAGLAHLLAISGLHLGLLGGLVFFVVRAGLALIPPLALRYPVKKWAAAIALVAALFYLFLAGAPVPTQRAFMMLALVLGAVMLDRTAISMRLVAWAAVVILLIRPESLIGASFQMSFAAVVALVAAYEAIGTRWRLSYGAGGPARRVLIYLSGVAMTTLIAGTATAPFAVQNFNQFAVYGLAGNLIAVPIVALWVMPLAALCFALIPLGLERLALVPMGWGIDLVVVMAEWVAGWPGAVLHSPSLPPIGYAAIILGGLWLALWRTRWRRWGAIPLVLGLASQPLANPPDILVTGDAALAGIRSGDGVLLVSESRRNRFERDVWMRRLGVASWERFPSAGRSERADLACDGLGCIYRLDAVTLALPRDPRALAEDCREADILVATIAVPRDCSEPDLVIDFFDLRAEGAHALWLDPDPARTKIVTVRQLRGRRPWVPGMHLQ